MPYAEVADFSMIDLPQPLASVRINSGAIYNPPIGLCHTVGVALMPSRAIPMTMGTGPS